MGQKKITLKSLGEEDCTKLGTSTRRPGNCNDRSVTPKTIKNHGGGEETRTAVELRDRKPAHG